MLHARLGQVASGFAKLVTRIREIRIAHEGPTAAEAAPACEPAADEAGCALERERWEDGPASGGQEAMEARPAGDPSAGEAGFALPSDVFVFGAARGHEDDHGGPAVAAGGPAAGKAVGALPSGVAVLGAARAQGDYHSGPAVAEAAPAREQGDKPGAWSLCGSANCGYWEYHVRLQSPWCPRCAAPLPRRFLPPRLQAALGKGRSQARDEKAAAPKKGAAADARPKTGARGTDLSNEQRAAAAAPGRGAGSCWAAGDR